MVNFNTTAKPFQTSDKADNHASFLEAGPSAKFSHENKKILLHRSKSSQKNKNVNLKNKSIKKWGFQ